MTINPRILLVSAMAMLAVHAAPPLYAQSPAVPPDSPGEIGRQTPGQVGQTLNANVSLTAGYDSDLTVESPTAANYLLGPQLVTNSNELLGAGEYQWRARDVQIRAYGTSLWAQNRQSGRVRDLGHTATGNLTARLPRRMTFLFDQTATYTQSPLYNLFPRVATTGLADPRSTPDYGGDDVESYSYNAKATLVHAMTRRSAVRISATGDGALTVRQNSTDRQSQMAVYGVATRFTRLVTRNIRTTAGYSARAGRFPDASLPVRAAVGLAPGLRVAEQALEGGLTFGRPMSADRRMVFDVMLGATVLSPLDQPLRGPMQLTDSHRLVGAAAATYLFRKTWQIAALYRRGIDYVPGLTEPVLTDGFSGRIDGSFTRRVAVQTSAGYASGASALIHGSTAFDTYSSDVRLNVVIARRLSTYVQYMYYLYDFRRYAPLVPGIPPVLERNSLRVGLTLSVPTLEW